MSDDAHIPPVPGTPPAEAAVAPPAQRRRRLWPWIVGGIAAVVIVGAAVAIPLTISAVQHRADEEAAAAARAAQTERLNAFSVALVACGVKDGYVRNVTVLDGGEALQLSRVTKYNGITYGDMECLLKELKAPSSIEAEIGQTRALDGRQSDAWVGYTISWGYHPDNGASIVIKHAD